MKEKKIKDVIASNLREYRKQSGYTQKELANKLGVSHNTISSWENGTNSIDIDTLVQICTLFNVTLNDIYNNSSVYIGSNTMINEEWIKTGNDPKYINNENVLVKLKTTYNLSNLEYAVIKGYLELEEEQRHAFEAFAQNVINDIVDPINTSYIESARNDLKNFTKENYSKKELG